MMIMELGDGFGEGDDIDLTSETVLENLASSVGSTTAISSRVASLMKQAIDAKEPFDNTVVEKVGRRIQSLTSEISDSLDSLDIEYESSVLEVLHARQSVKAAFLDGDYGSGLGEIRWFKFFQSSSTQQKASAYDDPSEEACTDDEEMIMNAVADSVRKREETDLKTDYVSKLFKRKLLKAARHFAEDILQAERKTNEKALLLMNELEFIRCELNLPIDLRYIPKIEDCPSLNSFTSSHSVLNNNKNVPLALKDVEKTAILNESGISAKPSSISSATSSNFKSFTNKHHNKQNNTDQDPSHSSAIVALNTSTTTTTMRSDVNTPPSPLSHLKASVSVWKDSSNHAVELMRKACMISRNGRQTKSKFFALDEDPDKHIDHHQNVLSLPDINNSNINTKSIAFTNSNTSNTTSDLHSGYDSIYSQTVALARVEVEDNILTASDLSVLDSMANGGFSRVKFNSGALDRLKILMPHIPSHLIVFRRRLLEKRHNLNMELSAMYKNLQFERKKRISDMNVTLEELKLEESAALAKESALKRMEDKRNELLQRLQMLETESTLTKVQKNAKKQAIENELNELKEHQEREWKKRRLELKKQMQIIRQTEVQKKEEEERWMEAAQQEIDEFEQVQKIIRAERLKVRQNINDAKLSAKEEAKNQKIAYIESKKQKMNTFLDKFGSQFAAVHDPNRIFKPLASKDAWLKSEDPHSEPIKLYSINSYSDAQILKDKRVLLGAELHKAGLQGTRAGREAILNSKPSKPVNPQLISDVPIGSKVTTYW